ncbi:MAG: hypothetical protein ABNG97_09775 [Sulfitobacter sp.]|jgi:hypothetical protein
MFNAESNAADLDRALSDAARRQMPFATARALSVTARNVADFEKTRMASILDKPTPFTLRGVYSYGASKSRPVAEVGIKKIQAQYLQRVVAGGTRRPEGRALLVPVGIRLNKYGNIPRRAVARLMARPDTFSGRVKGVAGIWQRPKHWRGSPKLLVRYEDKAEYSRKFEFQEIGIDYVRRHFPQELVRSLQQALATAR